MYLKRLEIQGFKTFPSRTVLEFGPGITAIIGPNGSGKSNVADAIRWVLGEQSPRLMRLRRLDDALYAGGARRPPAGLAEVSIWLDNADGWLPLPFEEVAVTRRLHRSGETDYLINRQRVRLRDVNELFLKARLGQNSYAIMGQGLVDQVLSLRPEERRALIEEAADIRRYRLRAAEATERLAAARESVERIGLLVAELAPRLVQLERQARRARDYQQAASDLAAALQAWYTGRLNAAHAALSGAQRQSEAGTQRLATAREEVARFEAARTAAQEELAGARRDEARAGSRASTLDDEARATEQQIRLEAERLSFVERRLQELEHEIAALTAERGELQAAARESAAARTAELAAAKDEAELAAAAHRDAEAAWATQRDAAARLAAEAQAMASELRAAEERLAQGRQQVEAAERELAAAAGRRAALLRRLREFGVSYAGRRQAYLATTAAHAAATEQHRQAQAAVQSADAAMAEATRVQADSAANLHDQQQRLALLLGLQRDLNRHDPSVAHEQLLRGTGVPVLGRLAAEIATLPGFERAIESALDVALAAVVLEPATDVTRVLSMLQAAPAERLALLHSGAPPAAPPPLPEMPGIVGLAAALVTCPPHLRSAIDALLATTAVVRDVATALRIAAAGGWTVVTVDGLSFRPGGLITGGHAGGDSRLALERELRALPEMVAGAEAALTRHQAEARECQRRAREASATLSAASKAEDEARRVAQRTEERLSAERAALAPIRAELRHLARTTDIARDRSQPAPAEQQRLTETVERLRAGESASRRREAASRTLFEQAATLRETAGRRLAQARGTLAALEREQQAATAIQESRRSALSRLEERINARRREAAARLEEIGRSSRDLQGRRAELVRLTARRDEAAANHRHLRECTRALQAAQHARESDCVDGQRQLTAVEREVLSCQAELSQHERTWSALLEEIEDQGIAVASAQSAVTSLSVPELEALHDHVRSLRQRVRAIGAAPATAETEYLAARERHAVLSAGVGDLRTAEAAVGALLTELSGLVRRRFLTAFERIDHEFTGFFQTFFGGGTARLTLSEPDGGPQAGVDVVARPPGKRSQSLALLSGGERSLTAVALLFALLQFNPAPFCVLDEVDAALDEANVSRFALALRGLATRSQFVVVTHNRVTMEAADTLYGVSMGRDGASTILSLRLAEIGEA